MRTQLRSVLAALVAAGLLAACGGTVPSGAAATVNGEDVSRDLLEQIVVAQMEGPQVPEGEDERDAAQAEIQRAVLSTLIGLEIVSQLADDVGVAPSDDQLDEALEEQREQAGGQEAFDGFLAEIGMSEDEFRDVIVADVVRRELLVAELGDEVTDADVEAAYEAQLETNVNSRHILFETEDAADDVLGRIDDGEDFADLVEEFDGSDDALEASDLGFSPPGGFVEEFAAALEENDPGAIVGPVETQFGFHVIEVLEPPEFEELEPQIRAELEQQAGASPALVEAFEEAFTGAEVTVDRAFGEWDPEQGQVVDPDAPEAPPEEQLPGGEGELTEEDLQRMLEEELGDAEAP